MFGTNPIKKPRLLSDNTLDVQEIFPTIQGEGLFVGWQSVFLRLGGCNLQCIFCDTEFDSYVNMPIADILQKIQNLATNAEGLITKKLVVITGGEPFLQPIESICQALIDLGFLVQIETNGTIYRKLPSRVKIICSPKNNSGKTKNIHPDLLPSISAFKFVVSANISNYNHIFLDVGAIPVFVQPIDEICQQKNKANLDLAIKICNQNGYILSLQMHKIIGIR